MQFILIQLAFIQVSMIIFLHAWRKEPRTGGCVEQLGAFWLFHPYNTKYFQVVHI